MIIKNITKYNNLLKYLSSKKENYLNIDSKNLLQKGLNYIFSLNVEYCLYDKLIMIIIMIMIIIIQYHKLII